MRVSRLDVISRLGLLYGQTVEGPLIVAHEAKAGACMRIVEFATPEVGGDATAAIDAHRPEVVRCKLLLPMHNGCNAVQIQVLEAHCLPHVQTSPVREIDPP